MQPIRLEPIVIVEGEIPRLDDAVPRKCKSRGCEATAVRGENWCARCLERRNLKPGDIAKMRREYARYIREPSSSRNIQLRLIQRIGSYVAACCTIYFVQMGKTGPIKIGKSRELRMRLDQLQTGSPLQLQVLAEIQAPAELEMQLHAYFDEHRMEGEWFAPAPEIIEFAELLNEGNLDEVLNRFDLRIAGAPT